MPRQQRIIPLPHPPLTRPVRQAVALAVLYMLLCSSYILVSGYVATHVSATPQQMHLAGRIGDVAFIGITGGIFGVISYLRYRRIRRQEETIIVQEKSLIQDER